MIESQNQFQLQIKSISLARFLLIGQFQTVWQSSWGIRKLVVCVSLNMLEGFMQVLTLTSL